MLQCQRWVFLAFLCETDIWNVTCTCFSIHPKEIFWISYKPVKNILLDLFPFSISAVVKKDEKESQIMKSVSVSVYINLHTSCQHKLCFCDWSDLIASFTPPAHKPTNNHITVRAGALFSFCRCNIVIMGLCLCDRVSLGELGQWMIVIWQLVSHPVRTTFVR